jgi:riboflavin synthase
MFTGLVECTAKIVSARRSGDMVEMEIGDVPFAGELKRGDSVSVSGACLTVVVPGRNSFTVEMMPETFYNTLFSKTGPGYRVNLERAMAATGRFEGHIVTGHVDLVSMVVALKSHGKSRELDFTLPVDAAGLVARKGSVAVQGVSLTVIERGDSFFRVGVIPETLKFTTLGELKIGDPVNLEYDILSKYLKDLLESRTLQVDDRLTMDRLAEMGWS